MPELQVSSTLAFRDKGVLGLVSPHEAMSDSAAQLLVQQHFQPNP
jgi:hypothetical protein